MKLKLAFAAFLLVLAGAVAFGDVVAARVDVGVQPTLLATAGIKITSVAVANRGANPMYLGGSTVAVATGFQVDPGQSVALDVLPGEKIYGIVAAGTERADVIQCKGR